MKSRMLTRFGTCALAVLLSLTLLAPSSGGAAQDEPALAPTPTPDRAPSYQRGAPAGALRLPGDPPAIGDVVAEDSLSFPGAIPGSLSCTSGRNIGEFVGEGYILKVTGPCSEGSQATAIAARVPELVIPDGEIRIETKVVSGHERAMPFIVFRARDDPPAYYELNLVPSLGAAILGKGKPGEAQLVPLAERLDLRGRMSRDDWNEYAIRLDGQNIWVLLNGDPILSAADSAVDRGAFFFGIARLGDKNNNAESAAVFRNLRISRLATQP